MNVEYTGRQTTVTPKLKQQAEDGIARIAKVAGKTSSAHVILSVDKYRQIAEVTITAKTHEFVATSESAEMTAALHDALSKVEQQAVRHNQKRSTERRHPKTDLKSASLAVGEEPLEPGVGPAIADA